MLVSLYRFVLRLYPAAYRFAFGREMIAVFEQRRADARNKGAVSRIAFCIREFAGLVPGALREWARAVGRRKPSEFLEQPAVANTTPVSDRMPFFYTCEAYFPRRVALVHGGILSLVLFSAVTAAYQYGVNRNTFHKPFQHAYSENQPQNIESDEAGVAAFSRSLVRSGKGILTMSLGKRIATINVTKADRVRWDGTWSNLVWLLKVRPRFSLVIPLAQGVERREAPDPLRDYASVYFRVIVVLSALDRDHDHVISAAEIADAPAVLRSLDTNHDGRLSPEECGQGFSGDHAENARIEAGLGSDYLQRAHLAFMRLHPVLAALDADHDGEISAREIENAAAALKTLDKNGDGQLTPDELFPDPLANAVAHFMPVTRDGRVSKKEWFAKTRGRYDELFEAADRNKDGFVTEEELTNEIRRRADRNGDGIVTQEELQNAWRSGVFEERR